MFLLLDIVEYVKGVNVPISVVLQWACIDMGEHLTGIFTNTQQ
jgi:hypothetical protein